jgi:hypothetical protein
MRAIASSISPHVSPQKVQVDSKEDWAKKWKLANTTTAHNQNEKLNVQRGSEFCWISPVL